MLSIIEKSTALLLINASIIITIKISIQQISLLESVALGTVWTSIILGGYVIIKKFIMDQLACKQTSS